MPDLAKLVKDCVSEVPITLHMSQTIEEAIVSLRKKRVDDSIIYFYVVDDRERLKGVVSTRKLLLKDPGMKLSDVMDKTVIRLSGSQTLKDALQYLSAHRLLALPVIDENERLLGVIDVGLYMEESMKVSDAQAASEVFQILGITIEEGKRKRPWHSYRLRMPWILCNMAGGTACAVISRIFEPVLMKVILLAMFIPLVLTLTESISMQSMSQSLQMMRKTKLSWKRLWERAVSESRIVLLLAASCGVLVGLLSLLWGEGTMPAFTIGTGLAASIALSATAGAAIPLLLHAKELDPKVAAGPVVLMFSDVITTTIYLGLATWWLL